MIEPASIVVLISGNGSNLQALIDACDKGQINGVIRAVISNRPDVYGLTRAQQANIDAITLNHRQFANRRDHDQALQQSIDQYQPDLVVLAGFMRILTPEFVTHYKGRLINIHPSLLPKYQGLNTHQRAIDAGDSVHGVSVHFVTEELDGGPVILQARVPIKQSDTADTLAQSVHTQEHVIYPLVVKWFCEGRLAMSHDSQAIFDNENLPLSGLTNEQTLIS